MTSSTNPNPSNQSDDSEKPYLESSSSSDQLGHNKSRIFYGWWICLGGAFVMAMSSGINFHGFGNFIIPLNREFGWNRTIVSSIVSLARLEAGFIGPIEGWVVDRIGPRKLMIIGIPIMGIGFVLLSRVTGLFTFMVVYILGVSLGNSVGTVSYTHLTLPTKA